MDSHFDEVVFIYQREAIFHCFDTIQWLKLLALGNQGVYWAIYLAFVHLRQEFESRWMFIKRKSIWTVCILINATNIVIEGDLATKVISINGTIIASGTAWKVSVFGFIMWENTDQKNSEYGYFLRSVELTF